MITSISPIRHPLPPIPAASSPTECKVHFLVLGFLASIPFLLIAPWEFAIPISCCIMLVSLPSLFLSRHLSIIEPRPLRFKPVHPIHITHQHVRIPDPVPPPMYLASRTRQPAPMPLPQRGRAPVGTGAKTPAALRPPLDPSNYRAPVGTGAPTRIPSMPPVPPRAGPNNLERAPVGRR